MLNFHPACRIYKYFVADYYYTVMKLAGKPSYTSYLVASTVTNNVLFETKFLLEYSEEL